MSKIIFFLPKVCGEWKEIALVVRDKVFEKDEQEEIELFDVKVCLFLKLFLKPYFCMHIIL